MKRFYLYSFFVGSLFHIGLLLFVPQVVTKYFATGNNAGQTILVSLPYLLVSILILSILLFLAGTKKGHSFTWGQIFILLIVNIGAFYISAIGFFGFVSYGLSGLGGF